MSQSRLIVPGFNGGHPMPLAEFELSPGMRRAGGGRSGRLADWSGHLSVADQALAEELNDHLEHNFEEGQSTVNEIIEDAPDGSFKLEGVALRYRGGAKFGFDAFSRSRA
jgi:hypothetical protein